MKIEPKRIFISDLPKKVSETDVRNKFSTYGQVSSIEIKQRKEIGPTNQSAFFAFVNLLIDPFSLQKCFKDFSVEKWKGSQVELRIAKESFLDRLKRERGESTSSTMNSKTNSNNNGLYVKSNSTCNTDSIHEYTLNSKFSINTDTEAKDEGVYGEAKDTSLTDIVIKNNCHKMLEDKLQIESVGNEPIVKIEKVKKKSKDPRRAEADLKRIRSVIEMKKGYRQQKLFIQNALSNVDFKPSNKIIFVDAQTFSEEKAASIANKSLFDDDDDENIAYTFDVKEQFQGRKGQKLLALQSKYKRDERFNLDARFLEDGQEETKDEEEHHNTDVDEKKNQLVILEQVLGKKITSETSNNKKRKVMLRFDPTQPDHTKYEVKEVIRNKKWKRKELETSDNDVDEIMPVVSKEKFYKVTENLKDALNENESFSLLAMFSRTSTSEKDSISFELGNEIVVEQNDFGESGERNPFRYDSSDDEIEDTDKIYNSKVADDVGDNVEVRNQKVALGSARLWSDRFFFRSDDYRLQEGIDFIRRFEIDEKSEFVKVRRDLKTIVKSKIKNNLRKNRPFAKKLGGSKMVRIKKAMKR